MRITKTPRRGRHGEHEFKLCCNHVGCLWSLFTAFHVERYALADGQCVKLSATSAVVKKYIVGSLDGNESEPFVRLRLDSACCHICRRKKMCQMTMETSLFLGRKLSIYRDSGGIRNTQNSSFLVGEACASEYGRKTHVAGFFPPFSFTKNTLSAGLRGVANLPMGNSTA